MASTDPLPTTTSNQTKGQGKTTERHYPDSGICWSSASEKSGLPNKTKGTLMVPLVTPSFGKSDTLRAAYSEQASIRLQGDESGPPHKYLSNTYSRKDVQPPGTCVCVPDVYHSSKLDTPDFYPYTDGSSEGSEYDEGKMEGSPSSIHELHGPQTGLLHESSHVPSSTYNTIVSADLRWRKLQDLRNYIFSLRSKLQEKRVVLREKQLAKAAADDKYIQHIRQTETEAKLALRRTPDEVAEVARIIRDCNSTRDEYGPLEYDCMFLEDELGQHEFNLYRMEENFYKALHNNPHNNTEGIDAKPEQIELQSDAGSEDSLYSRLNDDTGQLRRHSIDNGLELETYIHPLASQFLSKMGDVDILRERLDWNYQEKLILEEDKEVRERVGLTLSAENRDWLNEFERVTSSLEADLQRAEDEAKLLEVQCLAQGLIDDTGEPTDFATQERYALQTDIDSFSEISEYVKFPRLLPHPPKSEPGFLDSAPKHPDSNQGSTIHINQWLLHKLRSSPLDVYLLASTFEDRVGRISDEQDWQTGVLGYWYKDDSKQEIHSGSISIADSRTQAPPESAQSSSGYEIWEKSNPDLNILEARSSIEHLLESESQNTST